VVWTKSATIILDPDGRYLDADEAALELLGVATIDELRATPPDRFAPVPPDPEEQEAWREAYFSSRAEGILAEGAYRRLDGELVRVRTAILEEEDGRFRALFYPVERPTTDLTSKVYRISDVLAEWRAAERRLVALEPGSAEEERVRADIALLREQYQHMFRRNERRRPL
jgi:PAS domain-containing protein